MIDKSIPAATYAVFKVGGPDKSKDAWMDIWSSKKLKRTYTGDFVVLQDNTVTIYVTIRK
ncbi:hypothetical protein GCM10023189_40310 [Nibrella saemangeumensis]|uniref:Uncharacterized protein n=2 Tax=Nibrella saemangeumensis TaxID=1084526 RepID=A0ABP8NB75_9BACT